MCVFYNSMCCVERSISGVVLHLLSMLLLFQSFSNIFTTLTPPNPLTFPPSSKMMGVFIAVIRRDVPVKLMEVGTEGEADEEGKEDKRSEGDK